MLFIKKKDKKRSPVGGRYLVLLLSKYWLGIFITNLEQTLAQDIYQSFIELFKDIENSYVNRALSE